MSDLTEVVQWESGIYQLEATDVLQGGPGEIDNLQAQQLANRTSWLKQQIEDAETDIQNNADAIASNASAIASELTNRQVADAALQSQIDEINPGEEVIYENGSGLSSGSDTLLADKYFDSYRILCVKYELQDQGINVYHWIPMIEFGLGETITISAGDLFEPQHLSFRYVDNNTIEVTSSSSGRIKRLIGIN